MRKIFIELIDPDKVANFFVDSSNRQFELAREILDSKSGKIPPSEAEYMLKEYVLGLERQLNWANETMARMQPKLVATSRHKGTRPQ